MRIVSERANRRFWVDKRGGMSVRRTGSNRAPIDRDTSVAYTIEKSVWKFLEPGGTVADPGRALWGMLEYSTAELVDEWMDGRGREWSIWRFCVA